MKRIGFYIILILCMLSLSACEYLPIPKKQTQKSAPSISSTGPVLARVGDWRITINEFNNQIEAIIRMNKGEKEVSVDLLGLLARTFMPYVEKIDLKSMDGKKAYLEVLVNAELLAQEAEARGLDKDPNVAKSIRAQTVEILYFSLLAEATKDIKVTPLEVEEFYNKEYKSLLENTEERKVSEIVVKSESKAKNLLVELLTGSRFSTVASNNSIVESAKKGGDLGYLVFDPNMKFQKFWEIILTLGEGETSNVFKEPGTNNLYIVKVLDIRKGEREPLSKVYSQLEFLIERNKSLEVIGELINGVKAKFDIHINSDLIN